LGQTIKGKNETKVPSWVSSRGWRPLIFTLGVLLFFFVFFERLGYLICTFLLVSILVGVIGKRKWWFVMLFAIFSTLISYLIFGVFLKTQLPGGIFGR
jgi:hypothetical protein